MSLEDRHYREISEDALPVEFQNPAEEVVATLDETGNGDDEITATVDTVLEESFRRESDRLYFELDVVHEQFRDRSELYAEMMQDIEQEIREVEQETAVSTYEVDAERAKERLHELRRERRQIRRNFMEETHALQDRAVDIVQELDRVVEDERVADRLDDLL